MNKTSIFVKQSLMDTLKISKKNLTIMEIYRKLKEFKLRCPWDPDWHEWITMWAATRTQILYLLMSLYFFLLSDVINVKNGYDVKRSALEKICWEMCN